MNTQENLYTILGVSQDASLEDIKGAYRRLAFKYHPDRNRHNKDAAEEHFKKIAHAYTILSCPNGRKLYDRYIAGIPISDVLDGFIEEPIWFWPPFLASWFVGASGSEREAREELIFCLFWVLTLLLMYSPVKLFAPYIGFLITSGIAVYTACLLTYAWLSNAGFFVAIKNQVRYCIGAIVLWIVIMSGVLYVNTMLGITFGVGLDVGVFLWSNIWCAFVWSIIYPIATTSRRSWKAIGSMILFRAACFFVVLLFMHCVGHVMSLKFL